jgi:two-component system cell cycle sensor histidine kinase/response regulator CckA
VSRLAVASTLKGTAFEDVQTRECLMRIRTRAVTERMLIWRVETLDRAAALDIVSGSMPALSLSGDGTVEYANTAARELIDTKSAVAGSPPILAGHNPVVLGQTDGCRDVIYVADGQGSPSDHERPTSMAVPEVGVLDGLPVPVLEIAVDGSIISANSPARELLSLSSPSLPPLYDLVEGMVARSVNGWLMRRRDVGC